MSQFQDEILSLIESRGISDIFTVPGAGIYDILQKAQLRRFTIHVLPHEQLALHAASVSSPLTGRPGLAAVTSGPGLANSIAGLADAQSDGKPVLLIAGDVATTSCSPAFQEFPMDLASIGCIECWVKPGADGASAALAAISSWLERPDGNSFVLRVPRDLWGLPVGAVDGTAPVHVRSDLLERYRFNLEALAKSDGSLIVLGSQLHLAQSRKAVSRFVEAHGIRLLCTVGGVGQLDAGASGLVGRYQTKAVEEVVSRSEACMVLGDRLNDRDGGSDGPLMRIIRSQICRGGEARSWPVLELDEPTLCSALVALTNPPVGGAVNDDASVTETLEKELDLDNAARIIADCVPRSAVVVVDCGNHQIALLRELASRESPFVLTSQQMCTMGASLGAAYGALALDHRLEVWCVCGDGGLIASLGALEPLGELASDRSLRVLVFNDSGYGMVRDAQQELFGETVSSERPALAVSELGRAFSAEVRRALDTQTLQQHLNAPFNRFQLIEIVIPIQRSKLHRG